MKIGTSWLVVDGFCANNGRPPVSIDVREISALTFEVCRFFERSQRNQWQTALQVVREDSGKRETRRRGTLIWLAWRRKRGYMSRQWAIDWKKKVGWLLLDLGTHPLAQPEH